MPTAIADHWGKGDVYGLIVSALHKMSKPLEGLTVEDLAPVDHFHARGLPATVELADRLPIAAGQHILDIGCGLGGPARYLAKRFQCRVSGLDITPPFVEAANKLTALLRMQSQVEIEQGDGQHLPYPDAHFDGAYTQHVTMNVADRAGFFAQARRVLKPGAFFALTEHGLGTKGNPHYPVPWSADGTGAYLVTPEETRKFLEESGFVDIVIEDTGTKYVAGYRMAIERAEKGALPPLGTHLLMGETALEKTRNAARNIEEGRTRPIQILCRKPKETRVQAKTDLEILEQLNKGYVDSVQNSDAAWFDQHLSDDFLNTNPDGTLVDRAGFLAQVIRPQAVKGLEPRDVNIRILGEVAVIHAKTVYTKPDGQRGAGR
ncbi:MAG TPA: methyltransferase domain-containing protein, partial [Burkholderiales bacterium]|nr:methyltransferase domain-containing protein [Burkholderiales bacterium]